MCHMQTGLKNCLSYIIHGNYILLVCKWIYIYNVKWKQKKNIFVELSVIDSSTGADMIANGLSMSNAW